MQANVPESKHKVRWHKYRNTAMILASGSARSRTAPGIFEPRPYVWRGTKNPVAQVIERKLAELGVD